MTWFTDNSLSIGRTPLVRLNRIIGDTQATVLGKIETYTKRKLPFLLVVGRKEAPCDQEGS